MVRDDGYLLVTQGSQHVEKPFADGEWEMSWSVAKAYLAPAGYDGHALEFSVHQAL
jgi:hypothetical protein